MNIKKMLILLACCGHISLQAMELSVEEKAQQTDLAALRTHYSQECSSTLADEKIFFDVNQRYVPLFAQAGSSLEAEIETWAASCAQLTSVETEKVAIEGRKSDVLTIQRALKQHTQEMTLQKLREGYVQENATCKAYDGSISKVNKKFESLFRASGTTLQEQIMLTLNMELYASEQDLRKMSDHACLVRLPVAQLLLTKYIASLKSQGAQPVEGYRAPFILQAYLKNGKFAQTDSNSI